MAPSSSKDSTVRPVISLIDKFLLPGAIWLGFMMLLAHKEERFLFVIYPVICLAAACTLATFVDLADRAFTSEDLVNTVQRDDIDSAHSGAAERRAAIGRRKQRERERRSQSFIVKEILPRTNTLVVAIFFILLALSVSRTVAIYINYSAPMDSYYKLSVDILQNDKYPAYPVPGDINVCVGKEWYRFPSSFHLPSKRIHLRFLKSGFGGQLPQEFADGPNATSIIPDNFNDMNREEPSRYVDASQCHFVVDFDFDGQSEQHFKDMDGWVVEDSIPFLDASKSHRIFRAFWVPFFTNWFTTFGEYQILRNTKLVKDLPAPIGGDIDVVQFLTSIKKQYIG
eukprot:TRINITY_DN2504_c2_g2_i2.p1 TRINITY_DN2504_c2_g2~~TRINITY_DN2504_c2_g2_i2.p1  ORF type:complete len:391 (+),score=117.40 TRINITY_DN2504_c2_g2_i2:154-1173(+)